MSDNNNTENTNTNTETNEEPRGFFGAISDTIKSAAHLAVDAVVGIERALLPEFTLDAKEEETPKEEETKEETPKEEVTQDETTDSKQEYKQGIKPDETPKPLLTAIFHQPISESAKQAVEKVRAAVLPPKPESEEITSSQEEKPLPIKDSSETVENLLSEAKEKKSHKTLAEEGKAQSEKKEVEEISQKEEERIAEITHEVVERAKHNKEFMEAVLLAEDPLKLVDKDVHKVNLSTTVDHKEHAHPQGVPSR